MNFTEFKQKYLKTPVVEYPNNRHNKTPLVTVKVVTYNHAGFIEQCLDSILMQKSDFDFEILIAEDDSNDGTRDICKQYADKYPDKIRLLLNSRENNIPINGKPSGTFNNTYANYLIDSKYIAFIEGDDYWVDDTSLQKRFDFLEENEDHVMCFHNAKIYYQNLKRFDENLLTRFNKSISLDKEQVFISAMPTLTYMYRNKLLDVFDDNMLEIISGDTILKGKLANFGKARYMHEIKPAVYRIHNDGIYSSTGKKMRNQIYIETQLYILSFYEKNNWKADYIEEKLFLLHLRKFTNDMLSKRKLRFNHLKNSMLYFIKSKNKKYCVSTLISSVVFSIKIRKQIRENA